MCPGGGVGVVTVRLDEDMFHDRHLGTDSGFELVDCFLDLRYRETGPESDLERQQDGFGSSYGKDHNPYHAFLVRFRLFLGRNTHARTSLLG